MALLLRHFLTDRICCNEQVQQSTRADALRQVVGAGDDKLFGSNWGQLTADLWDSDPYKERNGINS
jgi:hypothetical protein